tara:strand:+ start:6565 stop:7830 length:1266 start_codon:yes stop_codon:yes gene_type:complete
MKPLLINTYEKGGAGAACVRLHKTLLEKGVGSKLLLKHKPSKNIQEAYYDVAINIDSGLSSKFKSKANRLFKKLGFNAKSESSVINPRDTNLEMFSYPSSRFNLKSSQLFEEADIINLHWVSDFIDYKSFFKDMDKPIVWTIHDMNPFSGGEHYLEDYIGMDENGYPIKRVITEKELQLFSKIIDLKKEAMNNLNNLHIVTLCDWMTEEVKKSDVFKKANIHLIPNGIDSEIFKPKDFYKSRELLNLPLDKKVILFVSDALAKTRKGYSFLQKAFQLLEDEDVILCSIGDNANIVNENTQIVELGYIDNDELMSMAYSAADVFVIPSLMDNLPNTVIESIMCGTPVIGFPIGGIPDMIEDGVNGYITKEISALSLNKAIIKFLNHPNHFNTGNIRENAVKKYNKNIQATEYINLFEKIIKG